MMKSILNRFMREAMDELFLNVSNQNTSVSLMGKDMFSESSIHWKSLIIRSDIFDVFLQPLQLVSGYLGSLKIEGLTELMIGGKQVNIELDSLFLLFKIDSNIDAKRAQLLQKLLIEMLCRDATWIDLAADIFKNLPGMKDDTSTFMKPDIMKKRRVLIKFLHFFFRNIMFSVKNVHIRFEQATSNGRCSAIGATLPLLKITPMAASSSGSKEDDILHMNVKAFQVYIDYDVVSYTLSSSSLIPGSIPFHLNVSNEFLSRLKELHITIVSPIDITQITISLAFLSPFATSDSINKAKTQNLKNKATTTTSTSTSAFAVSDPPDSRLDHGATLINSEWLSISVLINLTKLPFAIDHRQLNELNSFIEQFSIQRLRLRRLRILKGIFGKKLRSPVVRKTDSTYLLPQLLFQVQDISNAGSATKKSSNSNSNSNISNSSSNITNSGIKTSSASRNTLSPPSSSVLSSGGGQLASIAKTTPQATNQNSSQSPQKSYTFVKYPQDISIPEGRNDSIVKQLRERVGSLWKKALWKWSYRLIVLDLYQSGKLSKWKLLIKSAAIRKQYVTMLEKVQDNSEDIEAQAKLFDLEMNLDISAIKIYRRLAVLVQMARSHNYTLMNVSSANSKSPYLSSSLSSSVSTPIISLPITKSQGSSPPIKKTNNSSSANVATTTSTPISTRNSAPSIDSTFTPNNGTNTNAKPITTLKSLPLINWSDVISIHCTLVDVEKKSVFEISRQLNSNNSLQEKAPLVNNTTVQPTPISTPSNSNKKATRPATPTSASVSPASSTAAVSSSKQINGSSNIFSGAVSFLNSIGSSIDKTVESIGTTLSNSNIEDSENSNLFGKADIQFINDLFGKFTNSSAPAPVAAPAGQAGEPLGNPSIRAFPHRKTVHDIVTSTLAKYPQVLNILPPDIQVLLNSTSLQIREALSSFLGSNSTPKKRKTIAECKFGGYVTIGRINNKFTVYSGNSNKPITSQEQSESRNDGGAAVNDIRSFLFLLGSLFQFKLVIESFSVNLYIYNDEKLSDKAINLVTSNPSELFFSLTALLEYDSLENSKGSFNMDILFGNCEIDLNKCAASSLENTPLLKEAAHLTSIIERFLSICAKLNNCVLIPDIVYNDKALAYPSTLKELLYHKSTQRELNKKSASFTNSVVYYSSIVEVIVPTNLSITFKTPKISATLLTAHMIKNLFKSLTRRCFDKVDASLSSINNDEDLNEIHNNKNEGLDANSTVDSHVINNNDRYNNIFQLLLSIKRLFYPSTGNNREDISAGVDSHPLLAASARVTLNSTSCSIRKIRNCTSNSNNRNSSNSEGGCDDNDDVIGGGASNGEGNEIGLELSAFGIEAFIPMDDRTVAEALSVLLAILFPK